MCGIVAMVSDNTEVSEPLDQAVHQLVHRGPDRQATWIRADGRVGLGHTRLSIVDLENGDQPIANESGDLHIVASGEFYDFERIRDELARSGAKFTTGSDSEIALHLYERYGAKCLDKLRGEFAFIIWDQRNQTLFAARDRFGIKPLYYVQVSQTLWVGTEVKALLAAGAPAGWDQGAVFNNLFLCMDSKETLFRGVKQVPPGHYLAAGSGVSTAVRYWDLDYAKARGAARLTDSEYVESFRPRFEEAVRLRMRADVAVGCYLSGGLDSSYVLALAAKHAKRPVTAFTVSFAEGGYDETSAAREVAADLGVRLCEVKVQARDICDHFSDAIWHGEGIHYNLNGIARYLLSAGVQREGYKVVLAGEGADECFAGYAFCQGALQAASRRSGVVDLLRRGARLLRRDTPAEQQIRTLSPWLVRIARLQGLPAGSTESFADQATLLRSALARDFLDANADNDPFGTCFARIASREQLWGRARVHQLLYLWIKSVFANYILAAERMDMAHAVEVRLPFLDDEVFNFARRLPVSSLAGGHPLEKHLLRLAARPAVGERTAQRPKQPFFLPPFSLEPGSPVSSMAQDILRSDVVKDVAVLDRRGVLRLADQLAKPEPLGTPADAIVLMVLSICLLQQRFGL